MGWFDEQIRQRIENNKEVFSDSFEKMAELITGKSCSKNDRDNESLAQDAIMDILKFYHVKSQELPRQVKTKNDKLEFFLRPSGIMRRNVLLKDDWYVTGIGPLLGETVEGEAIALLPRGFSGYAYLDHKNGKTVKVTPKVAAQISADAICFYRPLPLKTLGIRDLMLFFLQTLSISDFTAVGIATLAVTLLGLLTPQVNRMLFSTVIESGDMQLLFGVMSLLVGATVSGIMLSVLKKLVLSRIHTKLGIAVESASMMRLLSLPADFFKQYSSGNIGQRLGSMKQLCTLLADMLLSTGFTGVFSLIYIGQIFTFAPALALPALAIVSVTLGFSIATILLRMKFSLAQMEEGVKVSGTTFALFSGIQKVKLSGAEHRAFSRWTTQYLKWARYSYAPPTFLKLNTVIQMAITGVGTLVLYAAAIQSQVSVSNYMAFTSSYGMVSAAFAAFSGIALSIANIKPIMEMVNPILKTVPEISENKKVVTRLMGGIELNNVSFRYQKTMPLILDNISLKIRSGQYVAIVGKTGCGKSTLMRLLLGFEQPQKGSVYYDGKDMNTMDLKSLRQNMGVVMQNGKLFSGDVFSNIVISAPQSTLADAWKAAEMAGIAEDIRNMPMGMNTFISEGSGGISGGQRQRIMIARAVAPKPKILLLDEATSALDNITQKIVSDSLMGLKCTRIVIAHRLSTIKNCDRIIMLEGGKIVEDGTYQSLIALGGKFAELVERQQVKV